MYRDGDPDDGLGALVQRRRRDQTVVGGLYHQLVAPHLVHNKCSVEVDLVFALCLCLFCYVAVCLCLCLCLQSDDDLATSSLLSLQ